MTPPQRRRLSLAILVLGATAVLLLEPKLPREQHVRFVLGDAAPGITELEVQYLGSGGEVARETRLGFEPGRAPRIVAHDPSLADGPYQLRIEVGAREGRRSVERQVTLSGGTTQVDLRSP
jgi:hypothetical protein